MGAVLSVLYAARSGLMDDEVRHRSFIQELTLVVLKLSFLSALKAIQETTVMIMDFRRSAEKAKSGALALEGC